MALSISGSMFYRKYPPYLLLSAAMHAIPNMASASDAVRTPYPSIYALPICSFIQSKTFRKICKIIRWCGNSIWAAITVESPKDGNAYNRKMFRIDVDLPVGGNRTQRQHADKHESCHKYGGKF